MSDIRAFVGHSFVQSDEEIVGKFLRHLDRLAKLHPSFSWVNAESAEPKELARKVLSLMGGKNVFIGICTKRERVVAEESLSGVVLQPAYRKGKKADFEWKTADWIIQEIGLAKGLGMELILLIEEGVRRPGGLQGDVEYITFNRNSIDGALTKLLEMITALTPRVSETLAVSQGQKAVAAEAQGPSIDAARPEWTTPGSDWTRDQYELALFQVMIRDDAAAVDQIDKAYLGTTDASDSDNAVTWRAYVEYVRLAYGKGGNIDTLKSIAAAHPRNDRILEYLAILFSRYDERAESAKMYESAASEASDADRKARLLGLAAAQHARAEEVNAVTKIVSGLKAAHQSGEIGELRVLKVMRRLAEIAKDDDALLAILERIVELSPDDFDARFALAYKHSECENNDLAMHHYLRVPYQERSAVTWNNIGVALDHFRLRDMAVHAYRKSKEMGETLAMSNLAQKFLSAGFVEEAQAECDQAILIKDYHVNILDVLGKLRELPDEERKNQDEALKKAKPKIEFYRAVGRAVSVPEPGALAEHWQGPDCVLNMEQSGKSVRITGKYELDANPFGVGVAFGMLGGLRQIIKYQVEYTGTLLGHVIVAVVSRTRDGGGTIASGLLESADNKTKTLMIVSGDHSEIRILENPHGVYPTYYVFKRLDGASS
jgi:tetratricopeptide (TPR) repeat protein